MSRQSRLLAAAAARGKELHSAAARGGGRDRSGSGRRAAAAVSPVVAGHRRSFAGHRLCSANSLPAAGDGPGHRSQEREDDARARRRAAPTARHGAVPPPRVDGSRGRTARSPCLGTAAVPVLRRRLDPAAARGRPVTPPQRPAPPAPSAANPSVGRPRPAGLWVAVRRGRSFQRTQTYSSGSEWRPTEGGGGTARVAHSCSAARILTVGEV